MPRCQRTFRRLPRSGEELPGWPCPFCEEGEVYEPVREAELCEYARVAHAQYVRDFGAPPDVAWPTRLLIGLCPECVREAGDKRYDLYLQRGSDPFQSRLQIGHEVFHRVCSRGVVFHWTHEMLACLASVHLLRQTGRDDYADRVCNQYRHDAESLPVAVLLSADLRVPSANAAESSGVYGRAYVVGEELVTVAGWDALCRLARWGLPASVTPDVLGWLESLPSDAATDCARILGIMRR